MNGLSAAANSVHFVPMSNYTPTIFTIGYEGLDLDEFLLLLKANDIEAVVDIRELPLSRKKGFSKNALSNALGFCGFDYVHIPELGCPKDIRNRYKIDRDWNAYGIAFSEYLRTQTTTVTDLATMATISRCALLCFEADYNYCHRSIVAHRMHELSGLRVKHILSSSIRTAAPADLELAAA